MWTQQKYLDTRNHLVIICDRVFAFVNSKEDVPCFISRFMSLKQVQDTHDMTINFTLNGSPNITFLVKKSICFNMELNNRCLHVFNK